MSINGGASAAFLWAGVTATAGIWNEPDILRTITRSSRKRAPGVEGYTCRYASIENVTGHQIAIIIGPSGNSGLSITVSAAAVRVSIWHRVTLANEVSANTMQPFVKPYFAGNRNLPFPRFC